MRVAHGQWHGRKSTAIPMRDNWSAVSQPTAMCDWNLANMVSVSKRYTSGSNAIAAICPTRRILSVIGISLDSLMASATILRISSAFIVVTVPHSHVPIEHTPLPCARGQPYVHQRWLQPIRPKELRNIMERVCQVVVARESVRPHRHTRPPHAFDLFLGSYWQGFTRNGPPQHFC